MPTLEAPPPKFVGIARLRRHSLPTTYLQGWEHDAVRVRDGARNGLHFLLPDHLGSKALTVTDPGWTLGEMRYREASRSERSERRDKPWGESRYASGSTPTDYRYTGQREESGFGLYYYRARWYDPALGRFVQADTIVPGGGPMAWDRYAYVLNRPLRFNDPSGHRISDQCGDLYGDCFPRRSATNEHHREEFQAEDERLDLCTLLPILCEGLPLNPLAYDTVGVGIPGRAKLGGGLEVRALLLFNMKAVRELRFEDFDWGIFTEGQVSAGVSELESAGLSLRGSRGSVLDQLGVGDVNVHAAGCLPAGVGVCVAGDAGFSPDISSIEWTVGFGTGFDLSAGTSYTDFALYANRDVMTVRLPPFGPMWVFDQ